MSRELRTAEGFVKQLGQDASAVESMKDTDFALGAAPLIWQTGWFQAGVLAGLLALAWKGARMAGQWRKKSYPSVPDVRQAIQRERERIAQDIHDDLGARLTQMMMLGKFAQREPLNLERARELVEAMSSRSREMARALDEIIWTVNPRNDSLPNLADYVSSRAQEFFEATGIYCRLDVSPNLPDLPLDIQVRHNLYLVIKEALNNAAKHSAATEVWLHVQMEGSRLNVMVEDNGCGFDLETARHGKGNGLNNLHARLQEIGGADEIESQPGCGCKIRLTMPINRN